MKFKYTAINYIILLYFPIAMRLSLLIFIDNTMPAIVNQHEDDNDHFDLYSKPR